METQPTTQAGTQAKTRTETQTETQAETQTERESMNSRKAKTGRCVFNLKLSNRNRQYTAWRRHPLWAIIRRISLQCPGNNPTAHGSRNLQWRHDVHAFGKCSHFICFCWITSLEALDQASRVY